MGRIYLLRIIGVLHNHLPDKKHIYALFHLEISLRGSFNANHTFLDKLYVIDDNIRPIAIILEIVLNIGIMISIGSRKR